MTDSNFNKADLISLLNAYTPFDHEDLCARDDARAFVDQYDQFCQRSLLIGHVTASAWVLDFDRKHVLLTHHAKLDRWMQLGGHIENDPDIATAALREAMEESGLHSIKLTSPHIFDVDVHEIPSSSKAPKHLHYDIRVQFTADRTEVLRITSESKFLDWILLENVKQLTGERSVLRMVEKSLQSSKLNLP